MSSSVAAIPFEAPRGSGVWVSSLALILAVLALGALVLGASVGSTGFDSLLRARHDPVAWQIVWDIRLPRTLGAWLAGALLGLAGAVAQGLFRNPLADPFLLGSASGAALAVALVFAALGTGGGMVAGSGGSIALLQAASPWLARVGFTGAAFVGALGGVLLALGSAAGYALITLCGRALAGRCHPLQTTTLGFATASVLLLPFALGTGFMISYPAEGWGLLVYLGCVPTAIAYALFLRGMHTTTATAASTITLLEPLTATLLAMVLFHERLGPLGVVGGALLLGAVAVLAREGKEMPMTGE